MSQNSNKTKFYSARYLLLISMIFITLLLAGTATAFKLVNLGWFVLPASTVIFPITYALGDIITEVYGYKILRHIVWSSLICGYLFLLLTTLILELPFPVYWNHQDAYFLVFKGTWLFTMVASAGMVSSALLNSYLMAKSKILLSGKYFWFRSICSTSLSDMLHILIMYPPLFLFTVSFPILCKMIISAYIYRNIYAVIIVYPALFITNFLKKNEQLDTYDNETNFNPFKLET